MIIIFRKKATDSEIKKISGDFLGYIKFVTDIKRGILAAGGTRHVEGEQLLLENGSQQEHLWGGGLDLETGEIDFDSMINIRPRQGNPSREVLDLKTREEIEKLIRKLLK